VNAVLQSLFCVDGFRDIVCSPAVQDYIAEDPSSQSSALLRCCSSVLLDNQGQGRDAALKELPSFVPNSGPVEFGDGKPRDAHDFLLGMLDRLHDQVSAAMLRAHDTAGGCSFTPDVMRDMFRGEQVSTVCCVKGHESPSHPREPIWSMDLKIDESRNPVLLNDLVLLWVHPPRLIGNDRYLCGECGNYMESEHTIRISAAPRILILQIGRFRYGAKLWGCVEFPEILTLNSEILERTFQTVVNYRLICSVDHLGEKMSDGHFVAHVRSGSSWYLCNDRGITVERREFPQQSTLVYLLFYERIDN
jgi:ubiquitin C-terminal hydrolase